MAYSNRPTATADDPCNGGNDCEGELSARYDAMVERWERENGKPCPLSIRLGFKALAYGPARPKWNPRKGRQADELARQDAEAAKAGGK